MRTKNFMKDISMAGSNFLVVLYLAISETGWADADTGYCDLEQGFSTGKSARICQNTSATGSIVYLDAAGFPRSENNTCSCNLSSDANSISHVTVTALKYDHGNFNLTINGKSVNVSHISNMITYVTSMEITVYKNTSDQPQCFKIVGVRKGNDSGTVDVNMNVTCFTTAVLPTLTTTTVTNTTAHSLMASRVTNYSSSRSTEARLIAGAAAGSLTVVVVLVVVIVAICRRNRRNDKSEDRRHSEDNAMDHDYDIIVNAGYISADEFRGDEDSPCRNKLPDNVPDTVTYSAINKRSKTSAASGKNNENDDNAYNRLHEVIYKPGLGNVYNAEGASVGGLSEDLVGNYSVVGDVQRWNVTDNVYNTVDENGKADIMP